MSATESQGTGGRGDGLELRLGRHAPAVAARLARWQTEGFGSRLWKKDPTLWSPGPQPEIVDRLGWLDLPRAMQAEIASLERLGREVRADGYEQAVVLGMGGSSLAPEVFARTFGPAPGYPALTVLDSTHPAAVRALADRLDLARTLFVVSSKSGTTTEMLSFFYAFWERLGASAGGAGTSPAAGAEQDAGRRGRHFVAVTDPGTPLQKLALERRFRAVVNAPPDVGGRYSAFTPFGLVPAALLGIDLRQLLARGQAMAEACGPEVAAAESPGLRLGAALGELTLAGRDKVTLLAGQDVTSFPDWLEQLIAESTGKSGRGIVPVVGEPAGLPGSYGEDRFFVALQLGPPGGTGAAEAFGALLDGLEGAGHPVARIRLHDRFDLGREIFRWEVAVAAAGAVIGIHPFNQPDVQLAKELAGKAMRAPASGPAAPEAAGMDHAAGEADEIEVAASGADSGRSALDHALDRWLRGAASGPGAYLGIQAYLAPATETGEALHALQGLLRDRTGLATTFGYGPRFLHSTGQLHKGGPAGGRFLQIVDRPAEDLRVPETSYSFGTLIRAQAEGDRQALAQRRRRVLRVDLGDDTAGGLARLRESVAGLPIGPIGPVDPIAPGGGSGESRR
jgi:transaldolase / glucose-6-phosphate isomerase